MVPDEDRALQRLAQAITDETPVDWDAEQSGHPGLVPRLERLRLIERIAEVHRTSWRVPDGAGQARVGLLFTWGHLQVMEKIGAGGFGAVYRAYDPRLQREVALKLLRKELAERSIHARRVLDEARRMARVRHSNVLVIHGADEHEGRVGFWTDLLDGTTLEERLSREGPLGAGEAAVIGIELCRALAAVHAAGLVHGDVKASNVMRDAHGRITLMDFGAGSERGDESETLRAAMGTPLTMAPELLRGEAPTPAADIYSLGVLLYRLVSGRYPVAAESITELKEKHRRAECVPLLDVRPDLPADWIAVIQKALASVPAERYRSAGAMEAALTASIQAGATPALPVAPDRGRRIRWPGWVLAVGGGVIALVAILLFTGVFRSDPPAGAFRSDGPTEGAAQLSDATQPSASIGSSDQITTPAAAQAFTANATMYRSRGGAREALTAGALVRPGDALFLELRATREMHVYVLNEDQSGEVFLLFPLPHLDLRNPLPGEVWHRLPGPHSGVAQDWVVTGGQGRESFLIVASRTALTKLEALIAGLTLATPDHPVSYVPLDPQLLVGSRGVGGLQAADPSMQGGADEVLSTLTRQLTEETEDPGGLWIRQFVLYNLGR